VLSTTAAEHPVASLTSQLPRYGQHRVQGGRGGRSRGIVFCTVDRLFQYLVFACICHANRPMSLPCCRIESSITVVSLVSSMTLTLTLFSQLSPTGHAKRCVALVAKGVILPTKYKHTGSPTAQAIAYNKRIPLSPGTGLPLTIEVMPPGTKLVIRPVNLSISLNRRPIVLQVRCGESVILVHILSVHICVDRQIQNAVKVIVAASARNMDALIVPSVRLRPRAFFSSLLKGG
jgi:hypothetical protein